MRIWDVSPGYLNRQSLLGEHRELHGLLSILVHRKKGYSRHPETMRWAACMSGLARRHDVLVAEMRLRGYTDRTPVDAEGAEAQWPDCFVNEPAAQYAILRSKYRGKDKGRIPLPRHAPELWAHHKYSVMARDLHAYRAIGRRVSRLRRGAAIAGLAEDLVVCLRRTPSRGRLVNALEHMWGHVADAATAADSRRARASPWELLRTTREVAVRIREPYLLASTALAELAVFVEPRVTFPMCGMSSGAGE